MLIKTSKSLFKKINGHEFWRPPPDQAIFSLRFELLSIVSATVIN